MGDKFRGVCCAAATPVREDLSADVDKLAAHCKHLKDLRGQDARVRRGEWDKKIYPGFELQGRRLGLVGFGQIARMLGDLARALGLSVVAFDPFMSASAFGPTAHATDLDELLKQSDFVSLHRPLASQTRGLIGARELALMGNKAFLINTARGGVADEAALLVAPKSGVIAGAGLDTFATEPPGAKNPLWALDNVIVSPHCGGVTAETRARVSTVTAGNVLACIRGEQVQKRYIVC